MACCTFKLLVTVVSNYSTANARTLMSLDLRTFELIVGRVYRRLTKLIRKVDSRVNLLQDDTKFIAIAITSNEVGRIL